MEDQFRKVDFIGKIAEKREIAKRTWEVAIDIEDKDFSFEPGQYVWVELRGLAFDDPGGSRRAFSVASSPGKKGRIEIVFRASESGYKKTLLQMPLGTSIDVVGPFGSAFLLPEAAKDRENYVLAGGVGIAPFLSWFRFCAEAGFGGRVIKLFYLNNSREEAAYLPEIEKIAAENKNNFQLINIFKKFAWSDAEPYIKDLGGKWYITGSQPAVDYFSNVLYKGGVTVQQMMFENFWPSKETKPGSEEAALEEDILNDKNEFQTISKKIESNTEREKFLGKSLSMIMAASTVFAAAEAWIHYLNGERFFIYAMAAPFFLLAAILSIFLKRGKTALYDGLVALAAFLILYPLLAGGYSLSVRYWVSSFPVIAFLFVGKRARFWGLAYILFLIFVGIAEHSGILALEYHTWDIVQIILTTAFIYALCIFHDLIIKSACRSMDYELSVSRIFREAVQSSTNHIVITDRNGIIRFANEAAQKTTGFRFSEMKNNTPRIWGGLMGGDFYKELWKKKLSGEPFYGEIINRRKNLEKYHTLANISPIRSREGRVLGFIGTETDITDIRNTERQLAVTQERFLQMAETIKNVFWITSLETGHVLFVSRAYEDIWNRKREDLYKDSREWLGSIHPEDRERVAERLGQAIKSKSGYSEEYRLLKAGGEVVYIKDTGFIVQNGPEAGKLMVGLAQDITKEKEIDMAKTEFVSLASHQLNAPLNSSRWYLEMLLDGDAGKLTKDQKKYLTSVYESNNRLIGLVAALLNVSRIELGTFLVEPEPVRLEEMCADVLAELNPQIKEKKLAVKEEYGKKMPFFQADRKLLRIVIQNLLTNAIKYTPEKGEIGISAALSDAGDEVGGRKLAEKSFVVTVYDHGYGIPKNEQGRIFSKLFRASNAREKVAEGTGLGLYIAKNIIESSGGAIWFESVEGKGSTFYVALPSSGMRQKEGVKALA